MQSNSERMACCVVGVNHNHLKHMIARSLEFGASENLRSTYTTQPSAPRMQSNSERMAGCVRTYYYGQASQRYRPSNLKANPWLANGRPPARSLARPSDRPLQCSDQFHHFRSPWPALASHGWPWPAFAILRHHWPALVSLIHVNEVQN